MTAKGLGRQLCLAPGTVRRHTTEGRLHPKMFRSGGRTLTMYKQNDGSGAGPDLVGSASWVKSNASRSMEATGGTTET